MTVAARAPVVRLASVEIHVGGEDTSIGRHTRRTVPALFIRARLSQVDSFLLREVSDIVHCLNLSLGFSGTENLRRAEHDIAVISVQFAANGAITTDL